MANESASGHEHTEGADEFCAIEQELLGILLAAWI